MAFWPATYQFPVSLTGTHALPRLQVPFLGNLINQWAEITGHEIATKPTERVLTQAVIQAFDAARGKNGPTAPPALPRASREEMDEVAAAAYGEAAPSSMAGPTPSLEITEGMADLSVVIPTSPSGGALLSAASEASTADGTFRDWISESRSELPSASHSFASASGRVDGAGLQSVVTNNHVCSIAHSRSVTGCMLYLLILPQGDRLPALLHAPFWVYHTNLDS